MKSQNDIELDLLIDVLDQCVSVASDWVLGGDEPLALMAMADRVSIMIGSRMKAPDHVKTLERVLTFKTLLEKLSSLADLAILNIQKEGEKSV